MPVRIDATIHEVNEAELLGTITRPGEESQHLYLKINYRLHAERRPFLYLGINKNVDQYCLLWDTAHDPRNFYVPSLQFFQDAQELLGGKEEGLIKVEEWSDESLSRTFSLEEYLHAHPSMQGLLNKGFTQHLGELLIQTPEYRLLLGHYPRKKRIAVTAQKDLSEALGPLIRATSRLPFTEKDDQRLMGAVTYLLNETFFEHTLH